ncbi:restriction endonuclease subunit S [Succinispira mobilis]|uniref:restriction endonuclease subunit S n=1 Tax=Succinispira mobilis TaxID=78120 RepID=UPI000364948D|nr:restriction endonuclease subunit S [Succinispira mobilis]
MSSSEWREVVLDDVVDILGDGLHGTPKYDELGDYYFINGNNLVGKIAIDDKTKRVGYEEYVKYKKDLNDRTILISINGTLGNIAVYNGEKIVLGKSACYFNVKHDFSKEFIKYVMHSSIFKSYLNTHSSGTTIKNMGLKQMRAFRFQVPPLPEQTAIAATLSCLDDKIELNNRMNKNLEEMAQAIFKSWFVDFEPFQEGEFEESELGMIPKGWRVGTIEEISKEIVCGKTPSTKDKDNFGGDVPFITIPDMHGNVYITKTERYLTNKGVKTQPKKTLPKNSVVVSCIATPGLVSLTSTESQTNQQINSIICKDGIEHYYIYQCMKSFSDKIKDLGSGGSTTLNLNKSQFSKIKLIIPNENSMLKYTQIIEPIFVKILENQKKTSILIETRDTLLPKLMSGEIRVTIEEVQ